jgi:hypothetical protein
MAKPAKICNSKYIFSCEGFAGTYNGPGIQRPRKVNAGCFSHPEGLALQNYDTAYNAYASNDQFQANILHFSSYSQQIQILKETVQTVQKILPTPTANQRNKPLQT